MSGQNRILRCCQLLFFVGLLLVMLAVVSENNEGKTITVDGDGEGDYETIEQGLNAAEEGDTVRVWEGRYVETLEIKKTVNLIGNGSANTIIDGSNYRYVVKVSADWTNVSGFTLTNSGSDWQEAGVYVAANHVTVHDNNCSDNNWRGVYIYGIGLNNCTLTNNTITGNFMGVFSSTSHSHTIANNTIGKPLAGYGISVQGDAHTLVNNTILGSLEEGLMVSGNFNTIRNNTVMNSGEEGIYVYYDSNTIEGNRIQGSTLTGLRVDGDSNVISKNTVLQSGEVGISVASSEDNSLQANVIENSTSHAISLYKTYSSTLYSNTMKGSGFYLAGFELQHWNTHTIPVNNTVNGKPLRYLSNTENETISSNAGQVILANCTNVTVKNLNLSNTVNGVRLGYSTNIVLQNLVCSDNERAGIYAYDCGNLAVKNCSLENNGREGLTFDGESLRIEDSLIQKNGLTGASLSAESSVIALNNTISNNGYHGLSVGGGTDTGTLSNNTIIGNSRLGLTIWQADQVTISENTVEQHKEYSGILISECSFSRLLNNTITNNRNGIEVDSNKEGNKAHNNNILNNTVNGIWMRSSNGYSVDATDNWWGDDSGPYHNKRNPEGKGDNVTDYVKFDPWTGKAKRILNTNTSKLYASIQNAVDEASAGHVIRVWEGQYSENVVVDKSLSLIGNGSANTTINGLGEGHVLSITAEQCVVRGFNITNGFHGIYLENESHTISANLILDNRDDGISLYESSFNSIFNNSICENGRNGIYLYYNSDSNIIRNNAITGNDAGIRLASQSKDNAAHGNNISANRNYGASASGNNGNVFNATDNWWGSATGPYHADKNEGGKGNQVTDDVLFDPWTGKTPLVHNLDSKESYYKIQYAIDNATAGDTIRIWEGTFFENIIINKTLSIIGNGTEESLIVGQAPEDPEPSSFSFVPVVTIEANDVVLEGFEVEGFGYILDMEKFYIVWDIGIAVVGNGSSISNVNLTGHSCGIFAGVSEMDLEAGDFGSWIGGKGLSVTNCGFSQMDPDPVAHLFFTDTALTVFGMEEMVFSDNTLSGCHVRFMGAGSHTMENNVMDDGHLLYIRDVDTQPVIPEDARQLIVMRSRNVVVEDRELRYGIQLYNSSDITVSRVEIATMDSSVDIVGCWNVKLNDSIIYSSDRAVTVRDSWRITVSFNTLVGVATFNAASTGISLVNTTESHIENNDLSDFEYAGIDLDEGSHQSVVRGNKVSMSQWGVGLGENLTDCIIWENELVDCNYGIKLDVNCSYILLQGNEAKTCNYAGIDIDAGSHHITITGNEIYHCRDGIVVSGEVHSFLLSENEITGDEQSVGIEMWTCENVTFLNNTIRGFSGSFSDGGISIKTGNELYFSGNHIFDCDGGISLENVEDVEITGETIEDNYQTAISIKNSKDVEVHHSWLEDNKRGFFVQDSEDILIHHCDIIDNEDNGGLWSSSSIVDARNNFWGEYSGPYHGTENKEGEGNKVEGDTVQFKPWLKSPFENEHPTATIDSISPNPTELGTEITFKGTGEDDGAIKRYVWWSSIDGEFHNGTSSTAKASYLSNGTHTISFKVRDTYGIWSEEVFETLGIFASPEAHIVSITPILAAPGEDVVLIARATGDLTGPGDGVIYKWQAPGLGVIYQGSEKSVTLNNLSSGKYSVDLSVRSGAGLWSASERFPQKLVISERPVAVIESVDRTVIEDIEDNPLNCVGNFTDDGDVVRFVWRSSLDGILYNGSQAAVSFDNLSLGLHELSLKVQDEDGLWSPWVVYGSPVEVKFKTLDVSIVIAPGAVALEGETVEFQADSSNPGDILRYVWSSSLDGGLFNSTAPIVTTDQLSPGTHSIRLDVVDKRGNWRSIGTQSLVIHQKPVAAIDSVTPSPANKGQLVTFTGSATDDNAVVEYVWTSSLDGELYSGENNSFVSTLLSPGTHSITLKVQDEYGAWSEEVSETLVVELNQPPTVNIGSPAQGATVVEEIIITGGATDGDGDVQSVEVSLDGVNWETVTGTTSWSYTLDTTTLENREHEIRVKAYDGENFSETVSVKFTVENKETKKDDGGDDSPAFDAIFLLAALGLVSVAVARKKGV